jgi:hypothetical protein
MCGSHKAEASTWAFCHVHQNLADVHGMCEGCLLSFAADDKSNLETYRSLTGKLGGAGIGGAGLSLGSGSGGKGMEDGALCSCCSMIVKVRSFPFAVLQRDDGDVGIGGVFRDVSRDRCVDEVDHAGYSVLKTSDSESELLQRVGESRRSPKDAAAINNLKEEFTFGHTEIKIADGNAEEEVPNYSDLTQVQDHVTDRIHPEDPKECPNIKANIQSNDLPRTDGEQITRNSDTRGMHYPSQIFISFPLPFFYLHM